MRMISLGYNITDIAIIVLCILLLVFRDASQNAFSIVHAVMLLAMVKNGIDITDVKEQDLPRE